MARTKQSARKNKKMPSQPPLPQGLPPRPPPFSHNREMRANERANDTYRARDDDNYQTRDNSMYQFGGGASNSYRPSYDQRPRSPPRNSYAPGAGRRDDRGYDNDRDGASRSYRPAANGNGGNFDFRYDAPPGLDFNAPDSYRPRSPPGRHDYSQQNNGRRPPRPPGRGGARGGYRGRAGPRMASDRAFLKGNREPTPELMHGMDEDADTGAKYMAVDDMSDSDETDMDMSEDDADVQQPKKKIARSDEKAADGDSVPRWSNPDPYTALPPPDESRGKKKDVVKLIRKARVTATSENISNVKAASDDFISFDFGDEDEEDNNDQPPPAAVQGVPAGPRSNQQVLSGSANELNQVKPATRSLADRITQPQLPQGNHTYLAKPPTGPALPMLPPKPQNVENSRPQSNVNQPQPAANKKDVVDLTSGSALGTRKRNSRDELKPPPVLHVVTGKPGRPSGLILKSWQAKPGSSATPWLGIDHSDSANMGVWLHKEIIDFHEYVKPRDFEQFIRVKLVQDLQARVQRVFDRDDDMRAFGSFPAGLYLPTADMDLVCVSSEFMNGGNKVFGQGMRGIRHFRAFISREKLALNDQVEMIGKAKVPLIKYVDRITGLKVDISFENDTGLIANNTFQNWKKEFPAMPILVTLIKHLLAMRGLNEPVNGGIGGFSITCLVVSLLQNMPQVQSRSMIPEHHLGEILMEFLDLYGNQFNTEGTAISMDPPGYMSKARANLTYKKNVQDKFCIIDPNRSDNDIAGGSSNTPAIRKCFSDAYQLLQKRMGELQRSKDRNSASVLEVIIGGNYSSFELQRAHLAHVHEKLYT